MSDRLAELVTVPVVLTRWQVARLKHVASERGASIAELMFAAAIAVVPDVVPPAKRKTINNRGRADTVAVKIGHLYAAGLTDVAIAAEVGCSRTTVRDKRFALGLPANRTTTAPLPRLENA